MDGLRPSDAVLAAQKGLASRSRQSRSLAIGALERLRALDASRRRSADGSARLQRSDSSRIRDFYSRALCHKLTARVATEQVRLSMG